MSTPEELKDYVIEVAKSFGFINKQDDPVKGNTTLRVDLNDPKEAHYFGFIRREEESGGGYSDFSLVFFPREDSDRFFVSLGIGTQGFTNDYETASLPGTRRRFLKILNKDEERFSTAKPDFSDIENPSLDFKNYVSNECPQFSPIVDKYSKYLPIIECLNYTDADLEDKLKKWIATYAQLRNWATNKDQRKKIIDAIKDNKKTAVDDISEIKNLLNKKHYIVLQGAPGTGKTYTVNKIAKEYGDNVFFEQFHAETSYSDFVYGLQPDLGNPGSFKAKEGVLYKAIKKAKELEDQRTPILLIIDEINRANLANVLGPVFYLFENDTNDRVANITIGDLQLTQLPQNLYVIATMNTADRSLAVVDFALRRRFVWYTLRPRPITDVLPDKKIFDLVLFEEIAEIFDLYATDEELNLQPGQSYFIRENSDESQKAQIIYELMPLIKEYLCEGYLPKAKEAFSTLFYKYTNKHLFE